jgi:hypothetical protein
MQPKFCFNCGKALPPDARFCPYCGTAVAITGPVIEKEIATKGSENGHEWVDLGLSVKWASCNIGAKRPEDYGSLFYWGEVSPRDKSFENPSDGYRFFSKSINFIEPNHKLMRQDFDLYEKMMVYVSDHLIKYNSSDNINQLDISDDAARVMWGGRWRIPSESDFGELRSRCMWAWTEQGGTKGYKVTGSNGNSIFIPEAGIYSHPCGYLWSSNLYSADPLKARFFRIESKIYGMTEWYRNEKLPIRPVTE